MTLPQPSWKLIIVSWCLGFLMGAGALVLSAACTLERRVQEPTPQTPASQFYVPDHTYKDLFCVNRNCQTREEAGV